MYHFISFLIILVAFVLGWFLSQVWIPLAYIPLIIAIVWVVMRTIKRPKRT